MNPKKTGKAVAYLFAILGVCFLIAVGVALISLGDGPMRLVLLIVFGSLGLVFTLVGGILAGILSDKRVEKKRARLMETGERIYAKVESCESNTGISVNGHSPYRVVCRHSREGVGYIYRSDDIWSYPKLTSDTVAVYVNPSNPHDYYVDLQSVMEPVVEL